MNEEDIQVALGKKIRELRLASGLTQTDLADAISISRTSVTNMELGRQRLLVDQLYKMAAALKATPQEFLPQPADIISASKKVDSDDGVPESVKRFAESIRSRAGQK